MPAGRRIKKSNGWRDKTAVVGAENLLPFPKLSPCTDPNQQGMLKIPTATQSGFLFKITDVVEMVEKYLEECLLGYITNFL